MKIKVTQDIILCKLYSVQTFSVNVKWGKEKFSKIECNTDETPILFKSTLYSLTGVLPERMKIMVKGATIGVPNIFKLFYDSCILITINFRTDRYKLYNRTSATCVLLLIGGSYTEDLPSITVEQLLFL